jgi:predicted GNAT family acetyltransferase
MLLTSETKLPFLNYAIPDDGADPDDAELDALVAAFRKAERMPRVEFLPSVAPILESALTSRGWTVEDRLPLMTCTARTLCIVVPPSGTLIEPPRDDRELFEMNRLQHEIFDEAEPADERSVARLRATLDRGGRALIGRDVETRAVVGAAQTVAPSGGATEVVGVVVAPSHRKRGLAAAMVSSLARECLGTGLATVFLEAAPGADGAYRNAGFRRTSTSMHISLADDPDA